MFLELIISIVLELYGQIMIFKFPKNDKNFHWTQHIKDKMLFYRISEQKIKTILKSYNRKEEGIAPNTMAVMLRNDTPKRKEEIWVMYQNIQNAGNDRDDRKTRKKIMISAWRYPGKSKAGKQIPIPDDVLQEIKDIWFNPAPN